MGIEKILVEEASKAIEELYGQKVEEKQIQIQKTRKEFEGDLTLNVFPFLKISRKSPEATAEELGSRFRDRLSEVVDFNVIKGFLNLSISNQYWFDCFAAAYTTENFGHATDSGKTVMVEYSSPNTNKPLHLGHLRNNFLGYSVAEILKANGHNVVKTQIINDRGIHICKSMIAWQKFGNGETPESAGVKGDHLVGKYYVAFDKAYKEEIKELMTSGKTEEEAKKEAPILLEAQEMLRKWEAKDPEIYQLWETMNGWVYSGFGHTYKTMGVDFDQLYYESDTFILGKSVVEEGLSKGVFTKREDGSVWINLEADGLDEKLLLRKDGTAVYMTQDIGTAIQRYKDFPSVGQMIYTVGDEQNYHFKVLFVILGKLGYEWAKECYHLSYGMVELPHGKMKSREGTVVDADDLMAEMVKSAREAGESHGSMEEMEEDEKVQLSETVGLGALKYFILKVDPRKKMTFNPEESVDLNGNTAPFIQYGHARMRSVVRKAGEMSVEKAKSYTTYDEREKTILKQLLDYPNVVAEAGANYSPALIANYTYELVKSYNSFYNAIPIFKEEDESKVHFRVLLSDKVAKVVQSGMKLLGINVPERM